MALPCAEVYQRFVPDALADGCLALLVRLCMHTAVCTELEIQAVCCRAMSLHIALST